MTTKPHVSPLRAALLLVCGLCLAPPSSGTLAARSPELSPSPAPTSAPAAARAPLSVPGLAPAPGPQADSFTARFNQAMLTVYSAKTPAELNKAAQEFTAARGLNPSSPEVHYNLGLVYLELDEYAPAADCFREYLALAPGAEDAARARGLLAEAVMLQQRLEAAKQAMLDPGAWRFLERRPAELDSAWFPTEFRLTKDGRLQVRNPRLNYSPLDKEAETRRNPWLTVNLRGRFFQFVVCLARENACNHGAGYCLIQGEIVFDGGRTLVVGRNYAYDWVMQKTRNDGASYIVVYELQP